MNANLSRLTIGSLSLTPAFDGDVTEYTATTSNASNKITAEAADENAVITVSVNDTETENGTSASWENGTNTVAITVTNGTVTKTYTVTVTKS